ncbi:MAG: S1 family peptidase [Bacteroidales bacterium]
MKLKREDMYQQHWKKFHKAVCSINFYGKTNSKILALTGFRVGDQIITDDQTYNPKEATEIKIRFYDEDGFKIFREFVYSWNEFKSLLPPKSEFENLGIAMFSLKDEDLDGTSSLELCNSCNAAIGKEAFTISYQYDQNNLALKSALISSNYINERKLSYIQFDGTVRPGISGSPLIDYEGGKVLGIVTNKEHKIVKSYREIINNIDQNLSTLETVKGKWFVDDVDPIQVLIVNQNQLKHFSREFFSNFAIKNGYALDINHLREYLEGNSEMDFEE